MSTGNTCEVETGALTGCAVANKDNKCVTCRYGYYVNSNSGDDLVCGKSPLYEKQEIWFVGVLMFFGFLNWG